LRDSWTSEARPLAGDLLGYSYLLLNDCGGWSTFSEQDDTLFDDSEPLLSFLFLN
jgi:hypothetical protein